MTQDKPLSERYILSQLPTYPNGYIPAKHTTTETVLKRMLQKGSVRIDSEGRYFKNHTS